MEIFAAEQFIRARLKLPGFLPSNTPIEPAPYGEDGSLPAVTYKLMSVSEDLTTISGFRSHSTLTYLVCALVEGSSIAATRPYALGIEQALHNTSATNSDGSVFSCQIIKPYSAPYKPDGRTKLLQQVGFIVRLLARGVTS